jgi:mRNA-degrading endonuclease YafQ of YafQ-DinJ toxin-antitoxin module
MRRLIQRQRFSNDLRRLKRSGKRLDDLFAVVDLVVEFGTVPPNYRPHPLTGEWKGSSNVTSILTGF